MEQRYRAVLQVQAGMPVTEFAELFGVSRPAVHRWLACIATMACPVWPMARTARMRIRGRSTRRWRAAICEMRRAHPRWGQRRMLFELGRRGCSGPVPSLGHQCWSGTRSSARFGGC